MGSQEIRKSAVFVRATGREGMRGLRDAAMLATLSVAGERSLHNGGGRHSCYSEDRMTEFRSDCEADQELHRPGPDARG